MQHDSIPHALEYRTAPSASDRFVLWKRWNITEDDGLYSFRSGIFPFWSLCVSSALLIIVGGAGVLILLFTASSTAAKLEGALIGLVGLIVLLTLIWSIASIVTHVQSRQEPLMEWSLAQNAIFLHGLADPIALHRIERFDVEQIKRFDPALQADSALTTFSVIIDGERVRIAHGEGIISAATLRLIERSLGLQVRVERHEG